MQDNCPLMPNPMQQDSDKDTYGDSCDNCPFSPNPGQVDSNNDGVGDTCSKDSDADGMLLRITFYACFILTTVTRYAQLRYALQAMPIPGSCKASIPKVSQHFTLVWKHLETFHQYILGHQVGKLIDNSLVLHLYKTRIWKHVSIDSKTLYTQVKG